MDLAHQVNNIKSSSEYLSELDFCNNCFLNGSCSKTCRRLSALHNLINDYDNLIRAFNTSCAELTLGSQYFMDYNIDEVKNKFLQD